MIIRREVMKTIGVLDEGYFTYFDDIDYCFNARKHGWPELVCSGEPRSSPPSAKQPASTANRNAIRPYLFEARRRYFLKNHGAFYRGYGRRVHDCRCVRFGD